jgi:succinate dehydrogenase / fumarate reductase iron-sulfur subunit
MTNGIVTVKVFRYNPKTDLYPRYKTYEVPIEEKMMVLQVLKQIFEKQDRTIAFRYFSCGFKLCNSCMMTINGQVKHACMFAVKPGDKITLEPLTGYPLIRDLVVDFGRRVQTPDGTFQLYKGISDGGAFVKKTSEE